MIWDEVVQPNKKVCTTLNLPNCAVFNASNTFNAIKNFQLYLMLNFWIILKAILCSEKEKEKNLN